MGDLIYVLAAAFQSNSYSDTDNDSSDLKCIQFGPF